MFVQAILFQMWTNMYIYLTAESGISQRYVMLDWFVI